MNWNPIMWLSRKYVEEIISKKVSTITQLTSKIEKENIGLNHHVINHKERIEKLEDRLREYEIKIASFNTAVDVVRRLNGNYNNQKFIDNE